MSYVSIRTACESLGIVDSAICTSKKYKPFYKSGRHGEARFDLSGYYKRDDLITEMIEKVKLLIMYLKFEENMTFLEIEKITNTNRVNIGTLNIGEGVAYKVLKGIAVHRPFHLKRFDEYYSWKHKKYNKKVFK